MEQEITGSHRATYDAPSALPPLPHIGGDGHIYWSSSIIA